MRIAFHYESLAVGGQQTQTLNILKDIFGRNEHELSFIYHYNDALASEYAKYSHLIKLAATLKATDYKYKPWKVIRLIGKVYRVLKTNKIDIIVSGSGLGSVICGAAARMAGKKHFRVIGCSLIQVEPTLYKFYQKFKIDRLIDGYFGWNAVFEELRKKGVRESKFHLTSSSVDTAFFYPLPVEKKESVRNELNIPNDKLIIGWIGRISYDMQVKNTIEMANILKQKGFDDFHLLFVGGGSWFEAMKDKLSNYGLLSKSTLTGWVNIDKVNELINVMDVVPLLEEDPQGGSIVRETMACGKVALSVDGVSGTQAEFMKANCSVLVAPDKYLENAADEIIDLYNDPQRIISLGENARKYVETNLTFESQATSILAALEQSVKGKVVPFNQSITSGKQKRS